MRLLKIDNTGQILLDTTDDYNSYTDLSNVNNFQLDPIQNVIFAWSFPKYNPYPSTNQDQTIFVLDTTTGEVLDQIVITETDISSIGNYGLRAIHNFITFHPSLWQNGYKYAAVVHAKENTSNYVKLIPIILDENYNIVKVYTTGPHFPNDFSSDIRQNSFLWTSKNVKFNDYTIHLLMDYGWQANAMGWDIMTDYSMTISSNSYDFLGGTFAPLRSVDGTRQIMRIYSLKVYIAGAVSGCGIDSSSKDPILAFTTLDNNDVPYWFIVHKTKPIHTGHKDYTEYYSITLDSTLSSIPIKIAWYSFDRLFIIRQDDTSIEIYDLQELVNLATTGGSIQPIEYKPFNGQINLDYFHFDPNGMRWYAFNYPDYYYAKMPKIS